MNLGTKMKSFSRKGRERERGEKGREEREGERREREREEPNSHSDFFYFNPVGPNSQPKKVVFLSFLHSLFLPPLTQSEVEAKGDEHHW